MALTTEEFVAAFHDLAGLTVGERRKNLFAILNDNVETKFDLTQLKAQTLLEDNLKFCVLKFYKNQQQLLEMLKEENPAVITKIFKLDWFIKETFGCMEGKRLVSEIFPNLSYNSKLKLLNQLCLLIEDSSKCDEFFWAVKEAYGTYFASKLLPACSQILILNTLEDNRVELTPKQLLMMIKRNPSMTEQVFEKLHNYDRNVDIGNKYRYVLKHLMQNDLSTFLRLNEMHTNCFQLGTRASRRFITNNNDVCLKHSEKLRKLFKEAQIGKCLKGNFPIFFSNIFPRSLERLIDNFEYLSSLIVAFKNEDKLDLMFNTFKKHYGGDLLQYHHFMVPKVFEWMSLDYKERWMKNNSKPKEITDETWISFMGTKQSIPLIKDKILLTSNVKERERLVKALVNTCKINKDKDAFEQVCEYMVTKHRNDQFIVRRAFLESTMDNFHLKNLEDRHLKYTNELIRPVCVNGECYWLSTRYLEDYIHVCFEKNWPTVEYMKLWLRQSYSPFTIFNNNPKYGKKCLEAFADVLPLCYSGEQLESQYPSYLLNITFWNKRFPKEKISLFKYKDMLEVVLQKLEHGEQSFEVQEVAMHCIVSDFKKASELKLLETLLNKCKQLCITIDIKWLLKHHASYILPHIKAFMNHIVKQSFSNHKIRETFAEVLDPTVKEAICAECKEIIKTDDSDSKIRSMHILSVMLTPEDFLRDVEEHYPEDLLSIHSISKFQQRVLNYLQNITPAHLACTPILKYCQGDYLKYTQNVLYRVTNNVAENKLDSFIHTLSTRAVSVRKHSVILALKLLDKAATNVMLKKFMDNEKNPPLRKNLFKSVFNLFLRNPDDYLWQLVKENIEAIAVDDTEAFCKLANSKRIPKPYFVRYVLFAWTTLDKLSYDDKLEEGKCRILQAVTPDNIASLPNDFCIELIRNNLFQKSHPKLQDELNVFTSKYLIYSGCNCMDQVFVVIKKYSRLSCKMVYSFVEQFCLLFVKQKCHDVGVLTSFSNCWNEMLKPYDALENYLHIQCTLIFVNCVKKKSIEEVGGRIAQLCNALFDCQSLEISIFKKIFVNSFEDCFLDEVDGNLDENHLLLMDSIVKNGNSNACLGLALALMPVDITFTSKMKVIYDSILEAAGHNSHPLVQIHLHEHLINK